MDTTPARRPWMRVGAFATAAVLLLGCGVISQVRQVVDAATVLVEFSELMEGAAELTYTAEYEGGEGVRVTLAQEPPQAAWHSGAQAVIFTEEHLIVCEDGFCQRSPIQSTEARGAEAGLLGGMVGPGFVTPEMALGMVAAAAFVPGAKVDSNEQTIAGQQSRCAEVTGLDEADDTQSGDSLRDFTICITEKGILARFSGVSTAGEERSVELVSFTESVDPARFEPPPGAEVVDAGS